MEFQKLKDAVEESYTGLKPFRDAFMTAHEEYVGPRYGGNREADIGDRPINMVSLGVQTYLRKLVPQTLQCLILTHSPMLRASAQDMTMAMNAKMQQMRITEELVDVALASLLGVGLIKVGIREQIYSEGEEGERLSLTGPYASAIDPTDWVHDITATSFRDLPFSGNRYFMSLEDAQNDERFNKAERAKLKAEDDAEQVDSGPESLSQDNDPQDKYIERVQLWDIWLPKERKVVTFSTSNDAPLVEIDWTGPEEGPYLMAGFNPVLKNVLPNAPVNHWLSMHDLVNLLYEKCGEQASRQKTIGVVQGNAVDDANRVIDAHDGQTIVSQNPQAINEMRFGGVDQNTLGFTINAQGWASYVQGNMDSIAGLAPAADTVGQEKIVESQSGQLVKSMQSGFVAFMKDVIRHLGHWMWTDPASEYQFNQKIEGTDIELPVTWPYQINEWGVEEDARKGPFESYQFDVEPYAMQDLTPQERLQLIRGIWQQDVLPLTQMGLQPDVVKYFQMIARYADLPELAGILNLPVSDLQMGEGVSPSGMGGGPKEYIHHNVSSGAQGANPIMQGAAMAAGNPGQG